MTDHPLYRFEIQTPCADETDALILADLLDSTIRDERNDPDVPVDVTFRPVTGPDTAGDDE
jgi:hypothetical protein